MKLVTPSNKYTNKLKKIINFFLGKIKLKIVRDLPLIYIHKYKSYEEYAAVQKFHNRKKINSVWSDEATLKLVASRLLSDNNLNINSLKGICHGSRNGYEVHFREFKKFKIIGTDYQRLLLIILIKSFGTFTMKTQSGLRSLILYIQIP